jgi:hypothetical protein
MNSVKTVVSKGEFARRKCRGPSAVSNWIAAGKISEAALVGRGNSAKIWVEQAEADLAASLDPSQQAIQAAPILSTVPQPEMPLLPTLPDQAPGTPPAPTAPQARPAVMTEREADLARRSKADADRAEHDAEAARRKLLVDEGKYVVAEDAARAWGRELAKLMSETETFLFSKLARQIAEKYGLDFKAVAVEVREAFRQFRANASEDARERREGLSGDDASPDEQEG